MDSVIILDNVQSEQNDARSSGDGHNDNDSVVILNDVQSEQGGARSSLDDDRVKNPHNYVIILEKEVQPELSDEALAAIEADKIKNPHNYVILLDPAKRFDTNSAHDDDDESSSQSSADSMDENFASGESSNDIRAGARKRKIYSKTKKNARHVAAGTRDEPCKKKTRRRKPSDSSSDGCEAGALTLRNRVVHRQDIIGWNVARRCALNDNRCGCTACANDKTPTNNSNRFLKPSEYKFVQRVYHGKLINRLVIFISSEKDKCYELTWHKKKRMYLCRFCSNKYKYHQVYARKALDPTDGECVMLGERQHVCEPIDFVPEDRAIKDMALAMQSTYYYLPDYQLITTKNLLKHLREKLIVFENREEGLGYVFTLKGKTYFCDNCYIKDKTKIEAAILEEDETDDKYVKVTGREHSCSLQKFEPESLRVSEDGDNGNGTAPEFRLVKRKYNNVAVQHLVIFIDAEHRKCYDYTWSKNKKQFRCNNCQNNKKVTVFVKLRKNEHDEDILEHGNNEHQCTPVFYEPEDPEICQLPCNYP